MNVILFKVKQINDAQLVPKTYTFLYFGETFKGGINELELEIGNEFQVYEDTKSNLRKRQDLEDGIGHYLAKDKHNFYDIYASWIDEHQML